MRVLFIQRGPFASQSMMSLSSILKKYGHVVDILVLAMEKDWLQAVKEFGPEVVAMSCTTGEHTFMLSVADRIKERHPDVLVILGGPHPTFCPDIIEHPRVDLIVRGEAEHAVIELLERLGDGADLSDVRNLGFKTEDGKTVHNPLRPLEQHLDTFPWPDRHLYDKYDALQQKSILWMITTRGCPYDCTFCYSTALKQMYQRDGMKAGYVRRRHPSNVVEELRIATVQWDIKHIDFQDDIFTLYPTQFLSPFLERYKTEIALPFSCQTRPDLVSEEIVSKLKDAGCSGVAMGLDAGDEEINNAILGRGITQEQIIAAADIIRRHGLKLEAFSMLGSPGETLETAFETLELNQRIKPEFPRPALTHPYPQTPLMEYCVRHGLLEEGFHVDNIENSYFIDSPITFQDKSEIVRLMKVFGFCIRWPSLTPLMKRLIRGKGGERFFDLLFRVHHAYSIYTFYNYNLGEFLKIALRARESYFAKKGNQKKRLTSQRHPQAGASKVFAFGVQKI